MKEYIGDSVYVEFDGHGLNLTTDNGHGPTNTIYLEPDVYGALVQFCDRLKQSAKPAAPVEVDEDEVPW